MALTIRIGRRATNDLSDIHGYLRSRSPRGAERVRQRILAVVNRLSDFPLIGHETQNPRIRAILVKAYPYTIFYTADDTMLTILHIRHSSRAPIDADEL